MPPIFSKYVATGCERTGHKLRCASTDLGQEEERDGDAKRQADCRRADSVAYDTSGAGRLWVPPSA